MKRNCVLTNVILIFLFTGVSGVFLVQKFGNLNPSLVNDGDESKSPFPNDLWYEIRSYPDGFDQTLFQEQMEIIKTDAQYVSQDRSVDLTLPWVEEGPGNIGGRFNVIQQCPHNSDVMYAGAAQGGLFKTTDNGQTWEPIFDDVAYLAISAIAIHPSNDSILYVGTGDKNFGGGSRLGDGVYRSIDAGNTWLQIGLEQTGIITEVLIHPDHPDTLFVSTLGNTYEKTNDRGLYKTTDGGQNWNNILFLSDSSGIIDMAMDPVNPDILYATGFNRLNLLERSISRGPESDIYKTTDGGQTWNQLTNGLPATEESRVGISIAESDPNILYAVYIAGQDRSMKDIYKSTDGGTNWVALDAALNGVDPAVVRTFGWYFGEIFVNPYNSDHVLMPGVDMFQTLDGGASWSQNVPDWWTYEVHADKHDVLFLDSTSYIIATDGGLYKTTDNGDHWVDIENIPVTQFYHIAVDPLNYDIYGGGAQDNGTMSGNASLFNNWERLYGGDGFRMNYLVQDPGAMYVETQRGNIVYLDANQFPIDVSPNLSVSDRTGWDTPYIINEDDQELYVGSSRINLMEGAPFGSHQLISGDLTKFPLGPSSRPIISEIEQSTQNSNVMMVGTSDGLIWRGDRDQSGNWTFTDVTAPNLPDRYVTGVKSAPNSSNFYICYSGYTRNDNSSYIYRSSDLGQTWEDISGDLPDVGINDICIVPNQGDNYLFVAVDGGVYFSENAGLNWNYVGTDLPFVTARELRIDPETEKLICGTYSRSMYSYDISWIPNLYINPVSVTEHEASDLLIYPNPAAETINVKMSEEGTLKIFDLQGQLIQSHDLFENNLKIISLSDMESGVYLYQFNDSKGKFVKQ